MNFKKEKIKGLRAIKIIVEVDGETVGRAYLYLINNDLYSEPYGLMEDVFVKEESRGQGIGKKLIEEVIEEAKNYNCKKLIAQSRYSRPKVKQMYEKIGFRDYGKNFRMDF